jgi:hypothetical protein
MVFKIIKIYCNYLKEYPLEEKMLDLGKEGEGKIAFQKVMLLKI